LLNKRLIYPDLEIKVPVEKFLYEELSWPEILEIVKEDRVVLIPTATIEDHGYHLPIATDVMIGWEVARRAAERVPRDVVLMPHSYHGYSPHHADFPGGIYIKGQTFVDYNLDITRSLIQHGFRRILFYNTHGSNAPWVDIIARLTVMEHSDKEVWCSVANLRGLPEFNRRLDEILEVQGGSSHAGETETSIMLAIRPDLVDMSKAVREMPLFSTGAELGAGPEADRPFHWGGEWWSAMTESGVMGDATVATRKKGEKLLENAISNLVKTIKAAKAWEIRKRVDHH
jgi:creatinine amidohydrolase